MFEAPGFFFAALLIFFFLLWAFTGGPTRPISFAGPYITPITNQNQTQAGYGKGATIQSFISSATPTRQALVNSLATDQSQLNSLQQQQTYNAEFGTPSPYKGIVTLDHYVSQDGASSNDEYVQLYVSSVATNNVDISGWKLVSTVTGDSATIPTGTEIPEGQNSVRSDIVLYPGDTAVITSGPSPIGISFRENECTGYFSQYYQFDPSMATSCPSPVSEFNAHYPGNPLSDDSCYEYVQNTETCQVPTASASLTQACINFVQQYLSYNGCVASHSGDARFLGNTWRIYLGAGARLWKNSRDTIKLLDAQGDTVDMFTY